MLLGPYFRGHSCGSSRERQSPGSTGCFGRGDFELDERAKWSNGDAFTPEDVIFNIERWIAPDSQSSNKTAFSSVQKVEKTGDHSVRITLSRGVSSLPEQLYSYTCPMVHRNFVKDGANWPANPIGTGPFKLESYEVGRQAVFSKRPDYWGTPAHLDDYPAMLAHPIPSDLWADLRAEGLIPPDAPVPA